MSFFPAAPPSNAFIHSVYEKYGFLTGAVLFLFIRRAVLFLCFAR